MASKRRIVRGVDDLKARLREMGTQKELDAIGYRATFGASKELRNAARAQARAKGIVDTGALVDNIAMKKIRDGSRLGYTVGVRHGTRSQVKKGNDPWYWFLHEFGTVHMAARPFLRPAFAMMRQLNARTIIDAALRNVLRTADRLAKKRSGR